METEMQTMLVPRSTSSSSGIDDPNPKYTSLRDVLAALDSSTRAASAAGDFDPSSISIRNQLVKHAASAYLQSAATLAPRDRGCLSRLWRRRAGCVRGPVEAWVGLFVRLVGRVVASVAGRIGGAWRDWRVAIA